VSVFQGSTTEPKFRTQWYSSREVRPCCRLSALDFIPNLLGNSSSSSSSPTGGNALARLHNNGLLYKHTAASIPDSFSDSAQGRFSLLCARIERKGDLLLRRDVACSCSASALESGDRGRPLGNARNVLPSLRAQVSDRKGYVPVAVTKNQSVLTNKIWKKQRRHFVPQLVCLKSWTPRRLFQAPQSPSTKNVHEPNPNNACRNHPRCS